MFTFGHIGITLAAVTLAGGIMQWQDDAKRKTTGKTVNSAADTVTKNMTWMDRSGLNRVAAFMDLRLLIIGSLVPDIIDKPLSFIGFGNGRSITHTLLVFLAIFFTSMFIYINYKKTFLIPITAGIFTHLVLDFMWQAPQTLFWPLLGWTFPSPDNRIGLSQFSEWWHTLITNPGVDISEGIGLLVIVAFIAVLIKSGHLKAFLLKAKI
jgi:inner membrane protein